MRNATLFILLALILLSCGELKQPPLKTANNLKLDAFMGTWHEVARLPLAFENNCVATSFFFKRAAVDTLRVESLCWYKHINGPLRKGVSHAYVKDMAVPGELMVHFAGPLSYPYNVFYIDPQYRFTIMGSPDRKYLWILSRTMSLPQQKMDALIAVAEKNGFDVSALIFPVESPYEAN